MGGRIFPTDLEIFFKNGQPQNSFWRWGEVTIFILGMGIHITHLDGGKEKFSPSLVGLDTMIN